MKNNKKLFTAMLLSTVIAGSAHAAGVTGNATDVFTWSGTVPAKPVTNGIVITSSTNSILDAGKLNFNRDGELVSSTAIGFKVKKMGVTASDTHEDLTVEELSKTNLSYKVLSFRSSGTLSGSNGSLDASQYYTLNSGPDSLTLNTEYKMDSNFVNLSVGKKPDSAVSATLNIPQQGEVITVEAVIMVEAVAI